MRPLDHLAWLCRLVSPFADRAEVERGVPRRMDWPTLVDLASWNGLLLGVHPAIEERSLHHLVPADALVALSEIHQQARARHAGIAAQIARVSAAMNAAGIEPLWLKGAALLIEGSRWSDRRWMSDIDLWVPPGRLHFAQDALIALGYGHDARQPDAAEHHLRPFFHPDEPLAVELHHALAPRASAGIVSLDRFLANARRLAWRGARVQVPAAADQLVHIASQSRPSAAAYFRGRLKVRRVVEFCQLASEGAPAHAADALRSACAKARQDEFAEEFLALASGLCALPGEFDCRGAMGGIAWKITFPRAHSVYFGLRGLASRGALYHLAHPRRLARTVSRHLRRSMDTRW